MKRLTGREITTWLWSPLLALVLFVGVALPLGQWLPAYLRQTETALYPVMRATVADRLPDVGGNIRYRVFGIKMRQCAVVVDPDGQQDIQGFAVSDDIPTEVSLTFEDDPSPGSSRPTGAQSFGVWRFGTSGLDDVSEVYVVAHHWCGLLWPTETIVGPFPLPE